MNPWTVWCFDCDGVLLDSNGLKTSAFYRVTEAYGAHAANALVEYHVAHGGMSRYHKFDYFFRSIVKMESYHDEYEQLVRAYATVVRQELCECPEVPGVRELLAVLHERDNTRLFVISGGDQDELRWVLRQRGFHTYFETIWGSPVGKAENMERLCQQVEWDPSRRSGVVIGDSQIDYDIACANGFDFVMVYGCTEWRNWRSTLPLTTQCIPDFCATQWRGLCA